MHGSETRALMRAVALLVVISLVRWGWSARAGVTAAPEGTVLPDLLAASQDATEEESRRGAPLRADEKVDPNRADEVELDRLAGIGPSTAKAIVAARDAGTVFIAPEDLLAVPGIGAVSLSRIRDHLDLSDPPRRRAQPSTVGRGTEGAALVDLNRADMDALQSLPGIGPAIAGRIVDARQEQLFTSIEDLVRVRGIGAATVERLRPLAKAGP